MLQIVLAIIGLSVVSAIGFITIEQFSIRVAEAWKIGRKKVDDGALLVIAKGDRKLLMAAVAQNGPVSICIDAEHSFINYKSGIYN